MNEVDHLDLSEERPTDAADPRVTTHPDHLGRAVNGRKVPVPGTDHPRPPGERPENPS